METELLLPATTAPRSRAEALSAALTLPTLADESALTSAGSAQQLARVCAAVSRRRRVRCGETIARTGDPFEQLIWVGSGLLLSAASGHVSGVHAPGEIAGLSALARGVHAFDLRAIEDGHVRLASFALIEQLAGAEPQLLKALHRAMSTELLRQQQLATLMAIPSAEGRLAAFLADLWTRRAYKDDREFVLLPMSRAEIGSLLRLTMESISRGFARLARHGLVVVRRRRIRIVDPQRLGTFAKEHRRANASTQGV